jgi:hypothetical protein
MRIKRYPGEGFQVRGKHVMLCVDWRRVPYLRAEVKLGAFGYNVCFSFSGNYDERRQRINVTSPTEPRVNHTGPVEPRVVNRKGLN